MDAPKTLEPQPGAKKGKHPMLLLGLPAPVWRVVHEYCQQASLHGLRYISSTDLPYIERYLWLGVFLLCLGFSINVIYEVWQLWREKPFFITFDSYMTPVWMIPTLIFYASLACPLGNTLRKTITPPEHVGSDVYDFLLKVSPTCDEMLKVCTFRGRNLNCCEVFEPVITDYGLCYSFNKLPADRTLRKSTFNPYRGRQYPADAQFWDPEEGYPVTDELRYNIRENIFPQWAQIAGENSGLGVELYQNSSEWQKLCSGGYSGFQVKVMNPVDQPVYTKVDERLALNRETSLMLKPSVLGSHPDLAGIPTRVRSCYFTDERRLRYFTKYTYQNCNLECNSIHTLHECGCVPIEYPRWNDTRICSSRKDYLCMQVARGKLASETMGKGSNRFKSPCNCLQGCQEIVYKASDFYTNYVYTGKEPAWANGTTIGPNSVARLTVHYRSSQFLGQNRIMRYSGLKFAGTCGGLLSLLLGFSVISAIEIVYAFLLRPLNRALLDLYHRRKTNVIVVEPVQQRQQHDTQQRHRQRNIYRLRRSVRLVVVPDDSVRVHLRY